MTLTPCKPFEHSQVDLDVCAKQLEVAGLDISPDCILTIQDRVAEFYEDETLRVMKVILFSPRRTQFKVWRKDEKVIDNHWTVLQAVKNKLLPGWYGYECYPPEEETIDTANRYHIWCFFEPLFPTYSKELAKALKGKTDG